jgi:hypothetical protein
MRKTRNQPQAATEFPVRKDLKSTSLQFFLKEHNQDKRELEFSQQLTVQVRSKKSHSMKYK